MTMDQVLIFVEAKEAGKRSASRLLLSKPTNTLSSNLYKKQETCTFCGTKGHRRSPTTRIRKTECLAINTTCNLCNKDIISREYAEPRKMPNQRKTLSLTLCGIMSVDNARTVRSPCVRPAHRKLATEKIQTLTIIMSDCK